MGEAAQFGEIYLQELNQVHTVNIREKTPCASAQKFLLKSIYELSLRGVKLWVSALTQIKILVSALTPIGNGSELTYSVSEFILIHP